LTRRVAVFTGTRAEYGLLAPLMRAIIAEPGLDLLVIVGAQHLSPEFGETWREIERDGFAIAARVEMLLSSDTALGVVKSLGLGTMGLGDALDRLSPDLLVVLGDRFEALAAVQAALILRVPVAHVHGGEITEGAYDDAIRHAITKMSDLHFTATEPYRRRVIQMGSPPERVFNVGALGLDEAEDEVPMPLAEVSNTLNFSIRAPYLLVTYHPATLANEDPVATMRAILEALEGFPDHQVIFTHPNADNGGRAITARIVAHVARHPGRALSVRSLGAARYRAVLAGAAAVLGNSSSGIIEAPSAGVPTVNIGSRQAGRLAAASVRHCGTDAPAIRAALIWALSDEGRAIAAAADNPYGKGDAARAIVAVLRDADLGGVKRFHDIAGAEG